MPMEPCYRHQTNKILDDVAYTELTVLSLTIAYN